MINKRIVGEVSKNWPSKNGDPICKQFEHIITANRERGFQLESWQLTTAVTSNHPLTMVETIIAVFVKEQP